MLDEPEQSPAGIHGVGGMGKTALAQAFAYKEADAIRRQLFIANSDEAGLPRIAGSASLREWRPGLHCLRFETSEDASGLVYVLTYKIFRHLQGDIFVMKAHTAHGRAYVSLYHRLPDGLSLDKAQAITAEVF